MRIPRLFTLTIAAITLTLLAIAASIAWRIYQARRFAQEVSAAGGHTVFELDSPDWIRKAAAFIKIDVDRYATTFSEIHLTRTMGTDRLLQANALRFRQAQNVTLEQTDVTDEGLAVFCGSQSLTGLELTSAGVTSAGLARLGMVPLAALIVRIPWCDADLERLPAYPTLTYLGLEGTSISERGLEHLRKLPKLNWLILRNKEVTSRGLTILSSLASLAYLDLGSAEIDDACLEQLRHFPRLRYLSLSADRLPPGGLQKVGRLPHIGMVTAYGVSNVDLTPLRLEFPKIRWNASVKPGP